MNTFQTMDSKDFKDSPFQLIGNEWMLITAEKDGVVNTMTASWGGLGVMWNMDVVFTVIRKSRFTKELIDGADSFSLSFLNHKDYQKELSYLGTVSGRTEDKIKKANLNVNYQEGVPFIDEADKVLICKKLFVQMMDTDSFVLPDFGDKFYGNKDYHDLYIGGITSILTR